ncbi:peptidylprolyl isomerase [bacterium]|nr:peptidylprolyl isomerase [bacterium]
MQITENKVVHIHYTLKTASGEVVDTTEGQEPLPYLHGMGMIVPGLEAALEGKSVGDKLDIVVDPKDGFGERREELQQEVSRKEFAAIDDLAIGMQFRVPDDEAQEELVITVVDMNAHSVVVDGNHALAGQTLTFEGVTVAEVRDATEEEIEHGHPHGVGGCDH